MSGHGSRIVDGHLGAPCCDGTLAPNDRQSAPLKRGCPKLHAPPCELEHKRPRRAIWGSMPPSVEPTVPARQALPPLMELRERRGAALVSEAAACRRSATIAVICEVRKLSPIGMTRSESSGARASAAAILANPAAAQHGSRRTAGESALRPHLPLRSPQLLHPPPKEADPLWLRTLSQTSPSKYPIVASARSLTLSGHRGCSSREAEPSNEDQQGHGPTSLRRRPAGRGLRRALRLKRKDEDVQQRSIRAHSATLRAMSSILWCTHV